jgi:glycosyltransferase involved in cell wall biosynthesis
MSSFRVVALIAAYNEADIIDQAIDHLVREGVDVYLLDDGSTDGTAGAAEQFLGNGLIHIERRAPKEGADGFNWTELLKRKQDLACEIDADWFLHHDADEFRESPWGSVRLREAIQHVDHHGYNAIDFQLLNFCPTNARPIASGDVRQAFTSFEPGQEWDRPQIKCWKRTIHPVDLVSSGGHEARFPGREVCPIRFLLRHYPIRSQAHGERKVFVDRRPRFAASERAHGWHMQYDAMGDDHKFVRDETGLTPYDPIAIRIDLSLQNRELEERMVQLKRLQHVVAQRNAALAHLTAESTARHAEMVTLRHLVDAQKLELVRTAAEREQLSGQTVRLHSDVEALLRDVAELKRTIDTIYNSRSWRVTRPLRWFARLLSV